jgi:ubiquitin C-terminal hydrolase
MDDDNCKLSSFINIGNTCYLNVILQALMNNKMFVNFLIKYYDVNNNNLVYYMANIAIIYWNSNCKIKPVALKKYISDNNNSFSNNKQNDSHELLLYIFNKIHDEICYEKNKDTYILPNEINNIYNEYKSLIDTYYKEQNQENKLNMIKYNKKYIEIIKIKKFYNYHKKNHVKYSPFDEIFMGFYCCEINCLECNNISITYEHFYCLTIEVNYNHNNLIDCIKANEEYEMLDENSKYNCSICKKLTLAKKRINIYKNPKSLIIHLKQYDSIIKNNKLIIPINNFKLYSKKYNLNTVIHHYGSINSGHYIAFVRNKQTNIWYKYNDEQISMVEDIEEITQNCYMLFYDLHDQ